MLRTLLVVLVLLVATSAVAGDTAELQIINGSPTLDLYISGKAYGKFGWSGFALANKDWAEIVAGPTFAPASWCELGVSMGVESGGTRFSETLLVARGRLFALGIHEHGHSGEWHKITADVTIAGGFAAGYQDQAFIGRGLRAKYTRGKVTLWGALLVKDRHLNHIVSVKISN